MQPSLIENIMEEKYFIEDLICRWGGTVSEAALDPGGLFFRVSEIEGVIGYRIQSGCAVVFGDPICSIEETARLTEAFHKFCKNKNLGIIYISASEWFAKWALKQNLCKVMIEAGEELIFNPQKDPKTGSKGYRLRNRLNHASNAGITVQEYLQQDENLENEIQCIANRWLQARHGPQISLGNLNFFENRNNKRWFFAKLKGEIIGVALLSKLDAHQGYMLKYLLTIPEMPRGSSELLMITILETLQKENCHFLAYGMVPTKQLGEIEGVGQLSKWFAQKIFKIAQWIFKLDQRKTYWEKFRPKTQRSYVLLSKLGLKELQAIRKSLKIDF